MCNAYQSLCLDVTNSKDEEGAPVGVADKRDAANQRWKVVYLDQSKDEQEKGFNKEFGFHINRPFYIRSRMMFHRVVDLNGQNTWAYLRRYVKGKTQMQWYFDMTSKTLKSKTWNNQSLTIWSNGNH